jgi:hypothetical protein
MTGPGPANNPGKFKNQGRLRSFTESFFFGDRFRYWPQVGVTMLVCPSLVRPNAAQHLKNTRTAYFVPKFLSLEWAGGCRRRAMVVSDQCGLIFLDCLMRLESNGERWILEGLDHGNAWMDSGMLCTDVTLESREVINGFKKFSVKWKMQPRRLIMVKCSSRVFLFAKNGYQDPVWIACMHMILLRLVCARFICATTDSIGRPTKT